MRIAILGGGVAGTVLAGSLLDTPDAGGIEVSLFEQNDRLGGLHRSEEFGGLQYDIGCFLFDREHAFLRAFPFLYDSFCEVDHNSRVLSRSGRLDTFPITIAGYRRERTNLEFAGDLVALLGAKIRSRRRNTLRSYVEYYLGPRVYRTSGLKGYIERFYGRPDTEVDFAFARQRLGGLPRGAGLRKNGFRFLSDLFGDLRGAPPPSQPWPCLVRPVAGFGSVYDAVRSHLESQGVEVRTGLRIEAVERRDGGGFRIEGEGIDDRDFDMVVSTIPPGPMARLVGIETGPPPSTIRLVSLCYRFTGTLAFEDAGMLYNFTPDGAWKRLTLFSAQYGRDRGDHYFTVECTLPRHDRSTVEELRLDFEGHIREHRVVFDGEADFQGSILTEHAYPVLTAEEIERNRRTAEGLAEFGITLTGRQATFVHRTSDAIAQDSMKLAAEIVAGRPDHSSEVVS